MGEDGILTGKVGEILTKILNPDEYTVYYDHGDSKDEKVGNIYVSIGKEVTRETQIGQMDIAIVRKENNHAVLLIEIEESSANPKTIVGDIFSFLIGNYVKFKKKEITVTNETTFLTLINGKEKSDRIKNAIQKKSMLFKIAIGKNNASVGKVEIQWFSKEDEIINIIRSYIN